MLIDRVELTNVKSYSDCTVRFTPGVNAMCGANGAGKSTVLEAIGFVLFDYLPYPQAQFIREGEKTATVTVRFTSSRDGREYDVTRRIGSGACYFVTDPAANLRLAEQKQDVSDWLRVHLGISATAEIADVYQNAIGVPQGLLTAAFLETAARRKGVFDPLLQVDEYERSWERLREVERFEKDGLNALEVEIAKLEAQAKLLRNLQEQAAYIERNLADEREERNSYALELAEAQTELATLQEQKTQHDGLTLEIKQNETALAVLRERLAALEKQIAEADTARAIVAQCKAGHDAWLAAHEQLRAASGDMDSFNTYTRNITHLESDISLANKDAQRVKEQLAEVERARERIATLEQEIDARAGLRVKLDELKEQRESLRSLFAANMATVRQLRERIENLHMCDGSACPTCGADLNQTQAGLMIAELEQALAEQQDDCDRTEEQGGALSERINAIEAQLTAASPETERQQLLAYLERAGNLQDRLNTIAAGILSDTEGIAEMRRELEALGDVDASFKAAQADIEAHQHDHDQYATKLELAGRYDELMKTQDELKIEIWKIEYGCEELGKEIIRIAFDVDRYDMVTTQVSRLEVHIAGMDGSIKQSEAQLQGVKAEIAHNAGAADELSAAQDRKEQLTRTLDATAMIRATIKEAGPYITRSLVQVVSFEADRIFGDIVQNPDMTLNWDESYEITVGNNGSTRAFKQLSGGEQMAAALAVRLALLKEMSAVDVALFDEPTSNLDAQKRELLAEQMLNVKGFSQLFVISHDNAFETIADNVVRVVKTNGKSVVS